MKIVLYLVAAIVTILFQTTFVDLVSISKVKPDVVLLLVVYIALVEKRLPATLAGFALGLVDGLSGTGLLGLSALTKSLAAFIVSSYKGTKELQSFYHASAALVIAALLQNLIAFTILSIDSPLTFWRGILTLAIPSAVYTTVFGLIVFALIPSTFWRNRLKSNIE